ncbi:MAG: alpha/beta hydrolase [Actinomycetota bacterium]
MEPVTFTADDGVRLEGELRLPDGPPRGAAVLCHAHPRHGGSKDHPVLWAIRNELAAARGLAVLGFNFRGTMGSSGTYGGGRDELRDARAAVGYVRARAGEDAPVLLAGWSFGASVALRAALDDRRVGAVALIGMPVLPNDLTLPPLPEPADLRLFSRPAMLLAGEHDAYCPPEELKRFAAGFRNVRVEILEGTDHYFWRRENEAAAIIGGFADEALQN